MTRCARMRERLAGVVDDQLDDELRHHVESCLRCQADVAQYRRLARALRSLESQLAVVPIGLHTAVMQALAEAQERSSTLRRGALLGAGGLIVAAAGTTAGILISRHRARIAS